MKKIIHYTIYSSLLFAAIIWLANRFFPFQNLWDGIPADASVIKLFCEQPVMNSPVRQPINTFSSIVYFIVAIYIFSDLKTGGKNNHDELSSLNRFYKMLLAFILLTTFAGSMLFHASLSNIFLRLDYSAVCAFVLFPSVYIWHSHFFLKKMFIQKIFRTLISAFFFLIIILHIPFEHKENHSIEMLLLISFFIVTAIVIALIEKNNFRSHKFSFITIAAITSGLIWFILDRYHIICPFPGHSLWHVSIGIAAFTFYLYIKNSQTKLT